MDTEQMKLEILMNKNFKATSIKDTSEEYHSNKKHVNSSSLRKALKSPASFLTDWLDDSIKQETEAMRFGTLAHKAILEGEEFLKTYTVMPDFGDMRLKKNKESLEAWKLDVPPNAVILSQDEFNNLKGMTKAIINHQDAFNLLRDVVVETSIYYSDPISGLGLRARPDAVSHKLGALIDVKTTLDCTRESFSRSIWNYRYDFQLAMYTDAIQILTGEKIKFHAFIAIEKKAPYEVAVYVADKELIESGSRSYKKAVAALAESIQSNYWPHYQVSIENINLPVYAQTLEA